MQPPPMQPPPTMRPPMPAHAQVHGEGVRPPPAPLTHSGFRSNGWLISTVKGPIIADRDVAAFREGLGAEGVYGLPEMLFNQSQVTLLHEASGICISLNAQDALREWRQEALPALQVHNAKAWQSARRQEIAQQKAVQLEWDWTYTTPFCGTVLRQKGGTVTAALVAVGSTTVAVSSTTPVPGAAAAAVEGTTCTAASLTAGGTAGSMTTVAPAAALAAVPAVVPLATVTAGDGAEGAAVQLVPGVAVAPVPASVVVNAEGTEEGVPSWQPCTEQIDKGLLMERDTILFFDEVPLYESDLDDNGVCQLTAKLRVMPKCWLVLLRLWIRVDGSMVRLRETRLFCRTDQASTRDTVLREVRHVEGTFKQLRSAGAPDEGPAYADAEAASQVFQSVAPIGHKLFRLEKLELQ